MCWLAAREENVEKAVQAEIWTLQKGNLKLKQEHIQPNWHSITFEKRVQLQNKLKAFHCQEVYEQK